MADPLSVAGSIVGMISLSITVIDSMIKYYDAFKGQNAAVDRTTKKLSNFLVTLQTLEGTLISRLFNTDEQEMIEKIESSINDCEDLVGELRNVYKNIQWKVNSSSGKMKTAGNRLLYPFRESTLKKLDEDIGEMRDNLSFALNVLRIEDDAKLQKDIAAVKLVIDSVRAEQISTEIQTWLKAPDATINHNAAVEQRHLSTGTWLLESAKFKEWLTRDNTFLWLNGIAGCGKSVISSTAIQYTFKKKQTSQGTVGIAFFYFKFDDEAKQDESGMLRALLLQLSGQNKDGPNVLESFHDRHRKGTPSTSEFAAQLRSLIGKFDHVYLFLDALDESPRDGRRYKVLERIKWIRGLNHPGLHLMATSREEPDIEESLEATDEQKQAMRNPAIEKDIEESIEGKIARNSFLMGNRELILKSLTGRADGVFRWVECQLLALETCPGSREELIEHLNTLPSGLDETYERMLRNINENSSEKARQILNLLCHSHRPLRVGEVIEAIAVDSSKRSELSDGRVGGADSLLKICPGLISLTSRSKSAYSRGCKVGLLRNQWATYRSDECADDERFSYEKTVDEEIDPQEYNHSSDDRIVHIAHLSVKEYLLSRRITSPKFALQHDMAHAEIARVCCTYLTNQGLFRAVMSEPGDDEFYQQTIALYPFASYAADHWHDHYREVQEERKDEDLDKAVAKLLDPRGHGFHVWTQLDGQALSRGLRDLIRQLRKYPYIHGFRSMEGSYRRSSVLGDLTAVNFASFLGLTRLLPRLLASVHPTGESEPKNAVDYPGKYGTALSLASGGGHLDIVKILLQHGAHVNAVCYDFPTALGAASEKGHLDMIELLLENGADLSLRSRRHKYTALCAACKGNQAEVVQFLLDRGADVNDGAATGETHICETPLHIASEEGHQNIVRLLLEKGASVSIQGGHHGTPLQVASYQGEEDTVRILLENGADVNAPGGYFRITALQAASAGSGDLEIVKLLLEKGADINAQGGYHNTALQAASANSSGLEIVKLLLEKGADINAQGGYFNTALQEASYQGKEGLVKLLLEKGADINAQGGEYNTALQAASYNGKEGIVKLLIENGADINAQGGRHDTALQAASHQGQEGIVRLLLDKGANINAQGGYYHTALQAASYQGKEELIKLLLENGADVNAQGGEYNTALQAASYQGQEGIVRLLLDKGADINAQGGYYHTALQAASYQGKDSLIKLLLEKGADIDAQGGDYGSVLQAASAIRSGLEIVKLLVEKGADVNAQGGEYGSALQIALSKGHTDIVKFLQDHGATVEKS